MLRRIAGLAAAALALVAPAAGATHQHHHAHRARPLPSASTYPTVTDPLALMALDAAEYWGRWPCGGNVSFVYEDHSEVPAGAATRLAEARWDSPQGPNTEAPNPSSYTNCQVPLFTWNAEGWSVLGTFGKWSPTTTAAQFAGYCHQVTHEFGHLLGHSHTSNPGDVMYGGAANTDLPPGASSWDPQIPQCDRSSFFWDGRLYLSLADAKRARAAKAVGRA